MHPSELEVKGFFRPLGGYRARLLGLALSSFGMEALQTYQDVFC
jgi:hypothetical protein